MKIGINCGHTLTGQPGCGAIGFIDESVEVRRVGKSLMSLLRRSGHTVIDCTNDYASSTSENLSKIVSMANAQTLDLFVSIHFNSGGGHPAMREYGTEEYEYLGTGSEHGPDYYIIDTGIDATQYAITRIEFRNESTVTELTLKIQDGKYCVEVYCQQWKWSRLIAYYVDMSLTEHTDYQCCAYGLECDIKNKIARIVDYSKVEKYYKNREMYRVCVRGNPAWDVGDYTGLQIGDYYKLCLILERKLTFDGSFKDRL